MSIGMAGFSKCPCRVGQLLPWKFDNPLKSEVQPEQPELSSETHGALLLKANILALVVKRLMRRSRSKRLLEHARLGFENAWLDAFNRLAIRGDG
jgi:hypothetical protein